MKTFLIACVRVTIVQLVAYLALFVSASCAYGARFEDCVVHCDVISGCPSGLACGSEGLCRTNGATAACAGVAGSDAGSDAAPSPASCAGLPTTCGADALDDCCASLPVPGGTFYRSYDLGSDGMYPDMSYPATVSAFLLDKYEVTVGRFRAFVARGNATQTAPPAAGAGAHARIPSSGWDPTWDAELETGSAALSAALACDAQYATWTASTGANEDLPINCVTWYEAEAFCAWDGGFLPSESEWNYAATGGGEQRAYPWSSPAGSLNLACSLANYNPNYPSGPFCTTQGGTDRVGNESPAGNGKWGQTDLGGNVDEWVLDWYASYSVPCSDCANLTSAGNRVVRSGDWINAAPTIRTASRNYTSPSSRDQKIGFRCARSLN